MPGTPGTLAGGRDVQDPMTRRALPLLLVAALAAVACATTSPSVAGGPDRPVSTSLPPTPSGPPITLKPKIVTAQPGLRNVVPLQWLQAMPSPDGRTLIVSFWGGPCMGVDHVDVDETPDTVTVSVYQGTPPSLAGSACPEIAMLMAVRVPLASPLGGRPVVDGNS
jgi:hypothetical protein